jgi:hypothetical protein
VHDDDQLLLYLFNFLQVCIYFENLAALAAFWVVLGGAGAYTAYSYVAQRQGGSGSGQQ